MPKPTTTGSCVRSRTLRNVGSTAPESVARAPVTPVRDTTYMKPRQQSAIRLILAALLVGATRKKVFLPV